MNAWQCTRGETADAAASEAAAARRGGSSPPGCTMISLASPRAQGIGLTHRHERFEPWSKHHNRFVSLSAKHLPEMQATRGSTPRRSTSISPVAQWQSARPITGRPRFDTVREDQYQQEITITSIGQTGWRAAPSLTMDPERSSLRRLGNGLLTRAYEVQLLPGPPILSITHD
jgi:hypothetical protein